MTDKKICEVLNAQIDILSTCKAGLCDIELAKLGNEVDEIVDMLTDLQGAVVSGGVDGEGFIEDLRCAARKLRVIETFMRDNDYVRFSELFGDVWRSLLDTASLIDDSQRL